jgi:DNA mismatch repair protein MutL
MIECYALARHDVGFRITVDDRLRHEWPAAADVRERCGQLWSARHAEQRLWAEGERDGVRVSALLGLPEHSRSTREGQVLLVNGRWIQNPLLTQALRQAYGSLLPPGRFPSAVLWIQVPPSRLDVNVHPTKREIRFADDERVFSLVAGTCARPLARIHPPFTVVPGAVSEPAWADRVRESPREQISLGLAGDSPAVPVGGAEDRAAASATAIVPSTAAPSAEPELWQLHRTYILAPVRGGLVIIDQHAAHERILYEEALERLQGRRGASQRLLFPALVDLSGGQFDLLLEIAPQLELIGWDLSPLGPPTVMIQGVPSGLRSERPGTLLQDVLDGLGEDSGTGGEQERLERIARSYACHAATRAGDVLGEPEMRALVDRLFATSHPHGDPHGRVTFVRLTLDELHRRFGRT